MSDKRITDLELLTELSGEYFLVIDDGVKARKYNITPIINDHTKLANIEAGSEVNTIESIKINGVTLAPDSDRAVDIPTALNNKYGVVKVAKASDPGLRYVGITFANDTEVHVPYIGDSSGDVQILDKYLPDATDSKKGAVKVDADLSDSSTNPIQNRAVTEQVDALTSDITTNTQNIESLNTELLNYVNRGYVEDGVAYFMHDDEELFQITGIGGGGGGGGGGGNNAVIKVTNSSGWLSKTVSTGAKVSIAVTWSSTEDEVPTGNGTLTVRVNNIVKHTSDAAQGLLNIDVSDYLGTGSNKVRITLTDVYGNTSSIIFTVTVVDLKIASSFDPSIVYNSNEYLIYTYTPTGNVEKTVHFVIDGVDEAQAIVTTSGRQQSQNLGTLAHGSHTLLVYFTGVIDGTEVRSNELFYDLIVSDGSSVVPIITSTFRDTTARQYETISIPYRVYTANSLTSQAQFYANDELVTTLTVDRNEHTWLYRPDEIGPLDMKIVVGKVEKEFSLTVEDSGIDVHAETNDLSLYLTAQGRSNNEEDPSIWKYNDIFAQLAGFNFVSDGWINDSNGYTALRVAGDARVTIPYKAFAQDFRTTGKTIELEFATRNILDYDSVILSCLSGNRGFELTAQRAFLRSEQSEIFTQYKEDEHIRVTFVVEKRNENRLIYIYTNGIMSGAVQYPADDDFSQMDPVGITIGSNYCTTDIYNIRIYDNNLTRHQILDNWIADSQDIEDLLYRYHHNDIYDEYGQVVISKLPNDLPYMIINAAELPQYKGDKKTVSGTYTDPVNSAKSFSFSACQINVQGTSSAVYARKNYDMQFKNGFDINGEHVDNYELAENIVPFNRFVLKADVASSEGANNVELVKLFNDITPVKRREMLTNPKVRWGIYGFPIVLFWNNTNTNELTFMGKYNFNLPKRAPGPYGYSGDMESWEFQNNTSNLMLFKTDYFDETMVLDPSTGESKEQWRYDYEARFPNDEWTDYSKLQELESFVYSTYRENATEDRLPASVTYDGVEYTNDTADYRLAKFKNEFGNYADVDSFIFYYLFTELFLMVDSRAKNLFIGFSGADTDPTKVTAIDRKAVAEPYDMDTAIGINNEGSLVFGYSLEDTDHLSGGANVFNGQDSVLWCNLRDSFPIQIQQMYQSLRSGTILSYANVEQRFEDHQDKWPEAIFNEDAYFKYLKPLFDDGTGAYLDMLQGSKSEQRKWWLYNRFRYMDSKFNAGDALSDLIQVRGYAKDNITVTPYADIYPSIKYGSYLVQKRGQRGVATTLECPIDTLNDTEIYIYSASQISSVGDLSGLKVGFADFSMATKLQNLKIGDSSSSYTNGNLKTLTLGNNVLLQTLDVRNCPNLTQAVDISGCSNIEYVYFDGTSVTGVTLPNGGVLKVLHLPSTVTNLTIRNQQAITEFVMPSYANITTLRLENVSSVVDIWTILHAIPANSRIRLVGFTFNMSTTTEVEQFCDLLDAMKGVDDSGNNVDKAQVYGTINGLGSITGAWLAEIQSRYPGLVINADELVSNLYYYNYDGSQLLYTEEILNGTHGRYGGSPGRQQTAQYIYNFIGWNLLPDQYEKDPEATRFVTTDRSVYAAYRRTVRTYNATFIRHNDDGGGTLYIQKDVPYGDIPVYSGETPESINGGVFQGWEPSLEPITESTTYTAFFSIIIVEPDLKYLNYTISGENMIITGLNIANIRADNLSVLTIPDTIQGYHVVLG